MAFCLKSIMGFLYPCQKAVPVYSSDRKHGFLLAMGRKKNAPQMQGRLLPICLQTKTPVTVLNGCRLLHSIIVLRVYPLDGTGILFYSINHQWQSVSYTQNQSIQVFLFRLNCLQSNATKTHIQGFSCVDTASWNET